MDIFYSIYIFIIGLVLGSFYNVVGLRIPMKKSIVTTRSACPKCQNQLTARELIPVLSYLIQKGKCKNCYSNISPIYPIMELMTGLLFVFTYYCFDFTPAFFVSITFISMLIIITVSDIQYMLIPDKILFFFAIVFIIERIFIPFQSWSSSLLGSVIGFCLLLVIAVVSKGGMGGGDIKLFAVLGFVLGWKLVLLAFFMSTLFGSIFGLIGLILKKIERGKPMPFGPYIAIGSIVAYFWGEAIINWYSLNFLSLILTI